jgi:tellurite resistance protein TerA
MYVNLSRPAGFRRILLFVAIYRGAPNWAAVDAVVTLYPTAGPQIEVRLDSTQDTAHTCAVAMLSSDGTTVSARPEIEYVAGFQADLDTMQSWACSEGVSPP